MSQFADKTLVTKHLFSVPAFFPWDVPGGPVVESSPSNARSVGLIPGYSAKIPHASQPKNQSKNEKSHKAKVIMQ